MGLMAEHAGTFNGPFTIKSIILIWLGDGSRSLGDGGLILLLSFRDSNEKTSLHKSATIFVAIKL